MEQVHEGVVRSSARSDREERAGIKRKGGARMTQLTAGSDPSTGAIARQGQGFTEAKLYEEDGKGDTEARFHCLQREDSAAALKLLHLSN